jgi:uracil-DNA glycosylase family 4
MASPISKLPLNELYLKKITPSVEAAIHKLEDFSRISPDYCKNVCRLKCKNPRGASLLPSQELDILIIQDHAAPKGKYDRVDNAQELIQKNIIEFICQKAGFQGLQYRITNLLKCAPNDLDFPKGKSPTVTVLSKCKPYLLAEIERTKPKVIISLSTAVTKALGFKKHSNTGNRGEFVGNVLITLHPRVLTMIRQNASGKLWGNDYFNVIKRDFEKAANMARGKLIIPPVAEGVERQRKNIRITRTIDDVRRVVETIANLPERTMISLDTETNSLDGLSEGAKLLTIQFGWRDPETKQYVAAVIPLWHRANDMYSADLAWKLIVPLLVNPRIPKVLHNAKFDILFIYHTTGVRVEGFEFDTMLMLHALDSGIQGCYGLKAAVWDHMPELGLGGYEELLPKLTKVKKPKEDGSAEWEDDEEAAE